MSAVRLSERAEEHATPDDVRALLRLILLDAAAAHIDADAYTAAQAEATIASGLRAGARASRQAAA